MANTTKTAIVTGASRGIGAGLVEAFLKRGDNVVANSRNITKKNPFVAAANVALGDGDIGDTDTAARIVDTAVSRFGRIDVLINNAGVFIPKPFTEYTTEDFNTLVSTTLAGFLYVSQLAVKQILREKSGSIIRGDHRYPQYAGDHRKHNEGRKVNPELSKHFPADENQHQRHAR